MEDGDDVSRVDLSLPPAHPLDVGARDSPDPQSDEDDEWDMQSVLSDTSTEVLVDEDEDDVVPRSFNLPTPADAPHSSDHLESSEQLPETFPKSGEEQPLPFAGVFGSDREHLYPLYATPC